MQSKAGAISDLLLNHAQATMRNMSALANVARKKPRILSKNIDYRSRCLRKRRIGLLTASLAIGQALTSANLAIIFATPIPKFPSGGADSQGPAIMNEHGEEIISTNNKNWQTKQGDGSSPGLPNTDAIQPLPFR